MRQLDNILVVCHDAGGAEVVSAFVKDNPYNQNFTLLVAGPAKKIFHKRNLETTEIIDTKKAINSIFTQGMYFATLLTSTSWGSSVELSFIREAKKRGIKSISYLDHWVNYKERFGFPRKNWEENLPNEIWVGDEYALDIASGVFSTSIILEPNRYFEEIKLKSINNPKKAVLNNKKNMLFMCEPYSSSKNSFGDKQDVFIDEIGVLDKVLSVFRKEKEFYDIVIRLHPSEKRSKYDMVIQKYTEELSIQKSNNPDIFHDIDKVDIVIGMESMGLVMALLCEKKVISFIPSLDRAYPLPFSNIIKIRNIEDLAPLITDI